MTRRWLPCVLAALVGCGVPAEDSVQREVPTRDAFPFVSTVLEPRCGTLDCHGNPARNLRVYGKYGLRADGLDVTGGAATTEAELDASYASLVSIDPEALEAVFRAGGARPERWVVVAKARDRLEHAGGARLRAGEPGDRCLVSWIAGQLDAAACQEHRFGPTPRDGELW